MSKIDIDAGPSSSATHRLTQPSTTLNRRYVQRPTNLAIEEAARKTSSTSAAPETAAPSRLVNLRVSTADLEAAKAAEEAYRAAAQSSYMVPDYQAYNAPVMMIPNVVELGYAPEPTLNANTPAYPTTQPMMPTSDQTMTAPITPMAAAPAANMDPADLAMSIAADYAAASIGASLKEHENMTATPMPAAPNTPSFSPLLATDSSSDSVDAIAQAASSAIASIREATEPADVTEQVASLKAFADNIKSNPALPEMRELSDTIDKFVSIAMKSSKVQAEAVKKATAKSSAKPVKVTALSPKANRAAAKVTKSSAKIIANRAKMSQTAMRSQAKRGTMGAMRAPARRATPEELKDRAIEQALHSVATMNAETAARNRRQPAMRTRRKGGAKRFAIAFVCAAICVGGIVAFISANIPDISVRVAAMQTGITAAYPSYVPRDYTPGDIYSENGKISMIFNGPDNSSFTLVEEKSSWDSSALLRNFVEPAWGDEYVTTHEQGITIYIANASSDAAWVNGGVLYKITSKGTPLTKKQVRSIVTSM